MNEGPRIDERTYGVEEELGRPLHWAVDGGEREAVEFLLGKGADWGG